ncbi:torsin-like protein [Nasonia vitripennis]|uniref:AAA+ ATPase domain-containing protein n=1 Tax=Nasonia vitripennis TaxID=7425 RepID=A0A7M7QAZ1_NASVI|nr:torsin-like protein [Nasonia vitripennis]
METKKLLVLFFVLSSYMQLASPLIFESLVIGGGAAAAYYMRCKMYECCDDDTIPRSTYLLLHNMKAKLYGQQIAKDLVFSAIHSHVFHSNPRKPLVLSFHGLPGSGKNYVVSMIANALYKKGEKSSHYHFFNGRSDFPNDHKVALYRFELDQKIKNALSACPRSMFVFDEVDKMPVGVLDTLVPFLDYTSWNNKEKSKAIFIFLSNTGSDQIVNRMLHLWINGKSRNDVTIRDFESLIELGAFNEKGGLYKSGTIESKLIDHHVPFLPMEEEHVRQCIIDAFKHWGTDNPSDDLIKEVLKHVTYGPPPHNLYSTSGCKKLDHKVSFVLFGREFDD